MQGEGWPDIYVGSEDDKALVMNFDDFNPDTSHDQAHMVIDRAVELGVDPAAIVTLMWSGVTYQRTETPFHPLTATPAQKTEAAIMAVRAWRAEK